MSETDSQEHSKKKTDAAGITLCDASNSEEKKDQALKILDTWRASHAHPMQVFKNRLTKVAEDIDPQALTAQRLKRVPSIIKKLNREYHGKKATMRLTQMQDIAGCRAVMSDVTLARRLYEDHYLKSDMKHLKVNEKDYITYPKSDGYRSIHLVYSFYSDKKKEIYNGLLVEVQIRSMIQHIWATAVETVGFFIGQAIKSNEGEEEWKEFFRLMSSALARMEHCPLVPGTPIDEQELYLAILKKEKELNVIGKLQNWMDSLQEIDYSSKRKNKYFFLLQLDTIQEKLLITSYSRREEEKALKDYAKAERKIYGRKEYDAVLVSADSAEDLRNAYPNYFLNTVRFIEYLNKIKDKVGSF